MADPKDSKTKSAPPADPPQWDGRASTEKYCALCQGMVNGNGCAAPVCPVRRN
jgi:hypothetical protein